MMKNIFEFIGAIVLAVLVGSVISGLADWAFDISKYTKGAVYGTWSMIFMYETYFRK